MIQTFLLNMAKRMPAAKPDKPEPMIIALYAMSQAL